MEQKWYIKKYITHRWRWKTMANNSPQQHHMGGKNRKIAFEVAKDKKGTLKRLVPVSIS